MSNLSDTNQTQCARLWEAIYVRRERLTKDDIKAKYGIQNSGARIDELNKQYGECIAHDMIDVPNRFGKVSRVALYYYKPKKAGPEIAYGSCPKCKTSVMFSIGGKCSNPVCKLKHDLEAVVTR